MKVPFQPLSEIEFNNFLKHYHNTTVVRGGLRDIDIFRSNRHIKSGAGVFSLLAKIGRRAIPLISRYIKPTAKVFGQQVISDVLDGQNLKHSIKRRGKQGLTNIGKRLLSGGKKRKYKKSVINHKLRRLIKNKRNMGFKVGGKRKVKKSTYYSYCHLCYN